MREKGEFQFNWIFVMIAGALFLLFFISFGVKYKNFQEDKTSIEVLKNFDNTLTALQSSSFKTFDSLTLPLIVENKCGRLSSGKKEINTDNIIFSPKMLNSKVLIWYQPYKMPFKITSFYYIIPVNAKYYFVEDSGNLSVSIINGLPEDIKKKVFAIKSSSLKKDGRLISLNINNPRDNGISVIGDANEGKVIINGKEYSYTGQELLYGIIFSDDYGCLLNQVQSKTSSIGQVYKDKINIIRNPGCDYSIITNGISKLQNKLDLGAAKLIDEENSKLIGNGCVGVF